MKIARYLGILLLASVVLAAILVGFASTWLRAGLWLYGVEDVRFQTLHIGLQRAELEGLEIGEPADQTIARIEASYSLGALIEGRIDRMTVAGLDMSMDLDELTSDDDATGEEAAESGQTPAAFPIWPSLGRLDLEASRIRLATTAGLVTIPLSGWAETIDEELVFAFTSEGASLGGSDQVMTAHLTLEGSLPVIGEPAIDRLKAEGLLSFKAENADIPDLATGLDGGGEIGLDVEGGRIQASTSAFNLAIAQLLLDAGPLKAPITVGLGADDRDLRLTGIQDATGWRVGLAGPLDIAGAAGSARADLDLSVGLNEEGRLRSLDRGDIGLDLQNVTWNGFDLTDGHAALKAEGVRDDIQGELKLALDGLDWRKGDQAFNDLSLEQRLAVSFDGEVLALSVAERGRIAIGRTVFADQLESGWFTLHLEPVEAPAISFETTKGHWKGRLEAEIDPVRLDTAAGRWWARIENLTLTGNGDKEGLRNGRIVIDQGRADLPEKNLAFTGVGSELELSDGVLASGRAVPVSIRAIRPLEEPRWFAPLRLEAALSSSSERRLAFDGELTSKIAPAMRIQVSGNHHLDKGDGGLDVSLPELIFDLEGLQPADLSPSLQSVLDETQGKLAFASHLEWRDGALSSQADLLIEELGLAIGPARLERVNALLHFDNLAPPTMPAGQELAIGLLDVGLPLTDGLVSMRLGADGRLAVDQLTWRFADGKVRARPFTFGSDVQDLTMTLDVDQLDLNGLLELTRLDGLSGDGRIDGVLPLSISETGVMITDGRLEATEPGTLRYRPDDAPGALGTGGESIGLMLQALENFRYDELDITLDGRTDGDTEIGLHIEGANPDLYDGYPIDFNLDLQGNLAHIVQTNLSNYQIPDRIRERLQGFER